MDEPPLHMNCRCIIVEFPGLPWQVEIRRLLDIHVGNTDPPFVPPPPPKGIFG